MKKTVFIFGTRRWFSFLAWSDDLGWLGYVRLRKSFVCLVLCLACICVLYSIVLFFF